MSSPHHRVVCAQCGEGVNSEVVKDDRTLCRACASEKYYLPVSPIVLAFLLLSFSFVAHAQQDQRANQGPPACDEFDKVQVPASDLPRVI